MKILVVGSGGREHALAWRLAQDGSDRDVHVAPGNAGMTAPLTVHPTSMEVGALVELATALAPDLVVVGPEAPLVAGLADELRRRGMLVLGPSAAAARLEASKAWTKEILGQCGIPTASHAVVTNEQELLQAVGERAPVLKVDGLASGKGVVVTRSPQEALEAGRMLLSRHGPPLVVEERLEGLEVSVLALCDGQRACMLPTAQDHKRVKDGDQGPNTGGMGAVSPGTHHHRLGLTLDEPALLRHTHDAIIIPVLECLERQGTPFVGVLYAGLMVNPQDGTIKVLEFNVRLGDPETQAMMLRIEGDLGAAMLACARGRVEENAVGPAAHAAVCVVMAADGYPATVRTGDAIHGLAGPFPPDVHVFHAATARAPDGTILTAGGRVLGVCARGATVAQALDHAYGAASGIGWPGVHYRRDVGRVAG